MSIGTPFSRKLWGNWLYLHVNKIACCSHMDADRRPKAPGSESNNVITYRKSNSQSIGTVAHQPGRPDIIFLSSRLHHNRTMSLTLRASSKQECSLCERDMIVSFRIFSCINNLKTWSWVKKCSRPCNLETHGKIRYVQVKMAHRGLLPNTV